MDFFLPNQNLFVLMIIFGHIKNDNKIFLFFIFKILIFFYYCLQMSIEGRGLENIVFFVAGNKCDIDSSRWSPLILSRGATGGRLGRAKDIALNKGATHSTIGLKPCIIASFLFQIYLPPPPL